jgi:tRNA pseudouridine55 synthase
VLVVDKPAGASSHDLVDAARRWLGTRRVGHLGTLDPMATGVLPLVVRDATKLAPFLPAGPKRYVGVLRLGVETDTLDADGTVVRRHAGALPDARALAAVFLRFVGRLEQTPPMYSAVKHAGVPLYRLARRGEEVERRPRQVEITELVLHAYAPPDAEIEVACSPGTYVRVLASDIGRVLGCGAHVASLRRTQSGPFDLARAAAVETLEEEARSGKLADRLISPVEALGLPVVRMLPAEVVRVAHGGDVPALGRGPCTAGARASGVDPDGALVAVLEHGPDQRLRPLRVFAPVAGAGRL